MGYAIVTRYHGPTHYRGSRVIATGPAAHMPEPGESRTLRATVSWDYGAGNPGTGAYAGWGDSDANHRRAADAVAAKLRDAGWSVSIAPEDRGASLPDDSGRVFVLRYGADREPHAILTCDCADPSRHAAPEPPTRRERAAALLSDTDIAGILDIAGEDA